MKQLYCVLLVMSAYVATGQVVINEWSAANVDQFLDNFGNDEDWIELYNAGSTAVNMSGYFLSDNPDNPEKWPFPSVNINPGGFLRVWCSDNDDVSNTANLHTNFKITQTKFETLLLRDPLGAIADQYVITEPLQLGHSYGRSPNGTGGWAVFTTPTPGASNGTSNTAEYAPMPTISLEAGLYASAQTVTLSAPTGFTIRYTTNGDEPIGTSAVYSTPLNVTSTQVVKARCYATGYQPSRIETNTYFIDDNFTIPVVSISGRDLPDLLNGSNWSEPTGAFELFSAAGTLLDEASGSFNKHGNDSWAYPQRGFDYITRDQMGTTDAIYNQIFPTVSERERFQRLILKPAANDNYPSSNGGAHIRDGFVHHLSQRAGLDLDERTYEPCLVFLNGEYWGVYELREKVDDADYCKFYYDQGEKNIDFIKTWGGTWQEYGSWDDWYVLRDFIENNDMTDPTNFAFVDSCLNIQSLVDYMILNTYVVCSDWLNWNTAWWRGRNLEGGATKWRYALWDMDATFGHYINYTGIPNTSPNADPCDNEEITTDGQGHVAMVVKLMQNEQVHNLYVNRFADLNNTYFSCDYMISLLDSLIGRIQPEMQRHINTWGGSMSGWEANVQELRDFILERCPELDGGIVDCYEVQGPLPVVVNIDPPLSPNKVKVNTVVPQNYPFVGDYFYPTTLSFEAQPADGWIFSHWTVSNNVFGPDAYANAIEMSFETSEEIVAHFLGFQPCNAPNNIVVDSSMTALNLQWNDVNSAISYEVRYRKVGDIEWESIANTDSEQLLSGLEPCTPYEVQIRTICGFSLGEFATFDLSTSCTVGTQDPLTGAALSVQPNPFGPSISAEVTLNRPESLTARLISVDGRVIATQSMTQGRVTFDTSALPAGVYSLHILGEQTQLSQLVVKH